MDMEDFVVQNLLHGCREAKVQAASELAKLGRKQRKKLAERGVISPLVSMLQSQDFEAIEAALLALLSLAFGSERNKIRIVRSGVTPMLLELLQVQSKYLVELALAALMTISSCAANKPVIACSGAIPSLVGILSDDYVADGGSPRLSMQGKLDAIATLQHLSTCEQIIAPIVSSGVVFVLLQLNHDYEKSSRLVEKAMGLLESIVTSSETALLQAAGAGGAIRALVETIEEGSAQCGEYAVGILLLICKTCSDNYKGFILREGVMPGLLQLNVDGTWRAKEAAQELLLLLRDYSGYGSRSKHSTHELIEQIMREIDAEGEQVRGLKTLRLVEEMLAKLST